MAKINPALIERLKKTLGVSASRIYSMIQHTSATHHQPRRDLAALILGGTHGLSIQKYASGEQMDKLSGTQPRMHAGTPSDGDLAKPVRRKQKPTRAAKKSKGNSVFVVHGRNEALRAAMFAFLRALGLNPMEWSHAVDAARGANPYVGDILEAAMAKVQAVVVVFSPDELAQLKSEFCTRDERQSEGKLQGQPRPNVLFEAGLALGAHPDKTLLVQIGKVRPFSDLAGKHLVRLTNDFAKRNEVANRLEKLQCIVNRKGTDWTTAGNFDR